MTLVADTPENRSQTPLLVRAGGRRSSEWSVAASKQEGCVMVGHDGKEQRTTQTGRVGMRRVRA